jgi:hypothetical protein
VWKPGEAGLDCGSSKGPGIYVMRCGSGQVDGAGIQDSLPPSLSGHLVNHPPQGSRPNIVCRSFLWPALFAQAAELGYASQSDIAKLASKVPNTLDAGRLWYIDEAGVPVSVPKDFNVAPIIERLGRSGPKSPSFCPDSAVDLGGIACITTRAVRAGEEIFLDYEIPPRWRPAWYNVPPN